MLIKSLLISLCLAISGGAMAQSAVEQNKIQIQELVQHFFDCLESRDSVQMKEIMMEDAQIWRRSNYSNPARVSMQSSRANIAKMHRLPKLKETALDFEIRVDNGIATAWVPYEFWLKGEFSHCGIDVFTFLQVDDHWKITNITYTAEKVNCKPAE